MRNVIDQIFSGHRGILAADESSPTIKKRFDSIDVEVAEEFETRTKMEEDLGDLRKQLAEYVEQFTIRIPELLAKIDRVEKIYKETVATAPAIMYETFDLQRKRLEDAKAKHGEYISPFDLITK